MNLSHDNRLQAGRQLGQARRSRLVRAVAPQKRMTCRAQNLFAGLAKIFSGDEERRPFSDQRPSRDKLLTPSNSDPPPEFPPYTVIQKTNDYSIRQAPCNPQS